MTEKIFDIKKKEHLLGALDNIKNNFIYGYLSVTPMYEEDWNNSKMFAELLERRGLRVQLPDEEYFEDLGRFLDGMKVKKHKEHITWSFITAISRMVIREAFEVVENYCENSNQTDKLTSQSWYWFVYNYRNIVSHGLCGQMKGYPQKLKKEGILKISWRMRTIKETDEFPMNVIFSEPETFVLLSDFYGFAESLD